MKKKLICWNDYLVPTGFGTVAKNLLSTMYEDYDVQIVGINNYGSKKYDTEKHFVYPITKDDPLGFRRLIEVIKREQPELIFLFQDIFHISDILPKVREACPNAKIDIYFPVDGAPFSEAWRNVFEQRYKEFSSGKTIGERQYHGLINKGGWEAIDNVNEIITYSDWAIKQVTNKFGQLVKKPIHKIYHGVNNDTFYPFTEQVIENVRESNNWAGKFTVLNINRFQPRKFIAGTVRAFSMFAKGYKVCKCGNRFPFYMKSCDLNMCPESDIVKIHKDSKDDVYLYLHMMASEPSMGPGRANFLQNHLVNAGFSDTDIKKIIGLNSLNIYQGAVSEEAVNAMYNGANINISSAVGEGAGLSLLEAAATGTPSIAPKNSAIPEQLRGTGHLIPNTTVVNMAMDNAHYRPVVDMAAMCDVLELEYQKWKKAGVEKTIDQDCIKNIKNNFRWEEKRQQLKKIFKEVLNEQGT